MAGEEISVQETGQESVNSTSDENQEQKALPENSSEIGTEQTSQANEDAGNTEQPVKPAKTPWYQHRINELTRERKAAEEARQRDVARLEADLAAARAGTTQETRTQSTPDIERTIEERAQQIALEQTQQTAYNDACNKVYSAGKKEFTGGEGLSFDTALAQIGMLGEVKPEFIQAATVLDNGHRVLHHLGSNLDLANELMNLPPVQLAIRMAEINSTLGKPSTKPVSRAPAPITQINGVGANDDLSRASLDSFMERRNRDAPIRR